jgi:hypothetical protein
VRVVRQMDRYRSLALLGSSYRNQVMLRSVQEPSEVTTAAIAVCQVNRYRSLALLGSSYRNQVMLRSVQEPPQVTTAAIAAAA